MADSTTFIEKMGNQFALMGHSPVVGRSFAYLLTCEDGQRTADGLIGALNISRGSTTTAIHTLMNLGLIELETTGSDRKRHYQVKPRVWSLLMRRQAAFIPQLRELAELGLQTQDDADSDGASRLREMLLFYATFEREIPALIEKLEKAQD